MADPKFLSSYQNPEGQLSDRLAPRTNSIRYADLAWLDFVKLRTVLDIGCNNGFFTREAIRRGARRAVGIDKSDCIIGARELAKEENINAEFWQVDIDSPEFRKFCPKFEVVFLLSVLTHVKDKEEFLDWLDSHVSWAVVFESNHGEKNKQHIELLKKYMWFESVEYLGTTDTSEKPHHLWICKKWKHEIRYPEIAGLEVEWIPVEKIVGWNEKTILNQKGGYPLDSELFINLKENIRIMGIRDPIVLMDEKDGVFRGFQGAHRYLAAVQLGYKNVPCRILRGFEYTHLNKPQYLRYET